MFGVHVHVQKFEEKIYYGKSLMYAVLHQELACYELWGTAELSSGSHRHTQDYRISSEEYAVDPQVVIPIHDSKHLTQDS